MNIQDHLRKYPNARPSTLLYLERREEKTKQLRSELDTASDRRSRMLADSEGETVLVRLIRKLRRA